MPNVPTPGGLIPLPGCDLTHHDLLPHGSRDPGETILQPPAPHHQRMGRGRW
jgi:hypothetical protein